MKKIFVFALLLLTGCSFPIIPLNYSAGSTKIVDGSFKIGEFEYTPMKSHLLMPNVVKIGVLWKPTFDKNIDKYFKDALFVESRYMGVDVNSSNTVVSGKINTMSGESAGGDINFNMDVSYMVKIDGKECYNKPHKSTSEVVSPDTITNSMDKATRLNIEKVFSDSEFINCISVKK